MRNALIVAAILAMASVSSARQSGTQYLVSARVFSGDPMSASSIHVETAPTLRMAAGASGTADIGSERDGIRLVVTPSDLGAGKTALRVFVQTRRAGQVQTATFHLLAGVDTPAPTVALRHASGGFMLDAQGRPLFAEFQTTIR